MFLFNITILFFYINLYFRFCLQKPLPRIHNQHSLTLFNARFAGATCVNAGFFDYRRSRVYALRRHCRRGQFRSPRRFARITTSGNGFVQRRSPEGGNGRSAFAAAKSPRMLRRVRGVLSIHQRTAETTTGRGHISRAVASGGGCIGSRTTESSRVGETPRLDEAIASAVGSAVRRVATTDAATAAAIATSATGCAQVGVRSHRFARCRSSNTLATVI